MKCAIKARYKAMADLFDPQNKQNIVLLCGDNDIEWVETWPYHYDDEHPSGGVITVNTDVNGNAINGKNVPPARE